MADPCNLLEPCFERMHQDVFRLCFVLCRSVKDAQELTFQAFLRLGAAKEPPRDEEAARLLLFAAAVRLCDDYFLRKPHRRPSRRRLEEQQHPFPVTDALWAVLRLPFCRRAAVGLAAAGFPLSQSAAFLRRCGLPPHGLGQPSQADLDALRTVFLPEDDASALNDRIYARFSERSVGVENAIHGLRSAFDRVAPWLALAALLLMAFAYWYTGRP